MKVTNYLYNNVDGWQPKISHVNDKVRFIISFGQVQFIREDNFVKNLEHYFPNAEFIGCSSSGEILDDNFYENSLVLSAIEFEKTQVKIVSHPLDDHTSSRDIAKSLVTQLSDCEQKLNHVFVLADIHRMCPDEFLDYINEHLPIGVAMSGGMAGNMKSDFADNWVWHNHSGAINQILAIGFYGDNLKVGTGSFSGFDAFGPKRKITKSDGNIVYEFDGQPALDLYKSYLGDEADRLPESSMVFPILLLESEFDDEGAVRGVLDVNEQEKSIVFAADVPQGSYVQLMHTNLNNLVNACEQACIDAKDMIDDEPDFALLVSCVGRKSCLDNRIFEEVEGVCDVLGDECKISGFYSFGEMCPDKNTKKTLLRNQTMTVTVFKEV